jgi:hypothetical protein
MLVMVLARQEAFKATKQAMRARGIKLHSIAYRDLRAAADGSSRIDPNTAAIAERRPIGRASI